MSDAAPSYAQIGQRVTIEGRQHQRVRLYAEQGGIEHAVVKHAEREPVAGVVGPVRFLRHDVGCFQHRQQGKVADGTSLPLLL